MPLKLRSSNDEIEKLGHQDVFVDSEEEVVAADNGAAQLLRDDPESANLGINFCNKELSRLAELLALGFDRRAGNGVTRDDAPAMKLHPTSPIHDAIIDLDECFPLLKCIPQRSHGEVQLMNH